MENLSYNKIKLRGDISHRILMSYSRLESSYYRPDYIFNADQSGWAGDWEGRTMLALIKLAQITGKEPSFLEAMLEKMDNYLNCKGYLGEVLPETKLNEQQFAGHNWLLSALIEYYQWRKNEAVLKKINMIIDNLYIPAIGNYLVYPTNPAERVFSGSYGGVIEGSTNNWYTSTDIGCAFICLDALSSAYHVFKNQKVKVLLDEMIEVISRIDLINLSMQTHATLSATRGILQMYKTTSDRKYLEIAASIFETYIKHGMTENYANGNWFNRLLWTEPCAIVDSLICALELFKITREISYLEIAHKIYYNALGHAQRPNGGFGCDICVGHGTEFIKHHGTGICEAYWCCTMRGAVGLSYFGHNIVTIEDNELYFLVYNDMEILYNDITITEKTLYPEQGMTKIKIKNPKGNVLKLWLFIPSYARNVQVTLNGSHLDSIIENGFTAVQIVPGNSEIVIEFEIPLLRAPVVNDQAIEGHFGYWYGFLMLGCHTTASLKLNSIGSLTHINGSNYRINGTEVVLSRIDDVIDMKEDDIVNENRQVLFAETDA